MLRLNLKSCVVAFIAFSYLTKTHLCLAEIPRVGGVPPRPNEGLRRHLLQGVGASACATGTGEKISPS